MKINTEELIKAVTNSDWTYISNYFPNKLYKYRSFQNSYNITNIENNTIKLTDPHLFNDPYDSALSYSVNFNKQIDPESFKLFIDENKGHFSPETLPYFDRMIKGSTITELFFEFGQANGIENNETIKMINELQEFLSNYLTEQINNTFKTSSLKICSFTTKNDNMLMWTHYADEHRGFCIEYDISDTKKNFELCQHLYPIIYSDKLFKPQDYKFKKHELWAQELVASLFKSLDWSYEDEWRFIIAGGQDNNYKY